MALTNLKQGGDARKTSLLIKIAGISSLFLFVTVAALTVYSVFETKDIAVDVGESLVQNEVKADLSSLNYRIQHEYGALSLKNGTLVDSNGLALDKRYRMIDSLSKALNVVATVFVRDGSDFRRLITSIVDNTGKRAVGTMLGQRSAAYAPVMSGQIYLGSAVILGNPYLTVYAPLFARNGTDIIGINFVGVKISDVVSVINQRCFASARIMILISVLMLLVSIVLTVFVFRRIIIKPVNSIVSVMEDVAQGDLSKQVVVTSNDEIAYMAATFNGAIQAVKRLLAVIRERADALSLLGNTLAEDMDKTTAEVKTITDGIQNVSERMQSQSASLTENSASMEQVLLNLEKLGKAVEVQVNHLGKSSAAIEGMRESVNSVVQTLAKNTENVTELAEASGAGRGSVVEVSDDIKEISRESEGLLAINSVIQHISSETNLLAMNAAIEAAHAGESGKGFAVVADEIRKLAENAADQSKTINEVLKKIASSIKKVITGTDKLLQKFGAIEENVETVRTQASNIQGAMEEQQNGSKSVLDSINSLNHISNEVKESSAEMLDGSRQVKQESGNLERMTEEIGGNVRTMAESTGQIQGIVQQVNTMAAENRNSLEILKTEVGKFKIA
jgi:methyl-accepting chemotaxis protein